MTRLNTQHDDTIKSGGQGQPEVASNEPENPCCCCICLSPERRRKLNNVMDVTLFKDIFFELFAWSNFLTNFAFFIPFMFLPDRAVQEGESETKGALLLSVVGIFNTAGKV